MLYKRALLFIGLMLGSLTASATIFGTVSGLIHDPQHRPVQGAEVTLRAANSAWTKSVTSDAGGEFHFDAVPLGEYAVTVQLAGFAAEEQKLVLGSGRDARIHFSLKVAQAKETVEVKETSAAVNTESSSHHHSREPAGDCANAWRRSDQQPEHDHQLCAQRVHGPRSAAHSRWTSSLVAD